MKRSIKIAVAAAVALSATSAFATNGDNLIGVGAKARGMGGVGIGTSHGAESALANPAMITSVKGTEVSFGGTIFMPDVKTQLNGAASDPAFTSDADLFVIPEVAIAQNAGNGFYWGVGMYGTAGMGVDYRNAVGNASNAKMVTNLQLMQFAVPLAYKTGGLSIAVAPVLQYGSLDINFVDLASNPSETQGVAQDFGTGYNLGVAYEMGGLTVGATYKSAIEMDYKGQLSVAAQAFNVDDVILNDKLEQPAEYGIGVSYKMGGSTLAFDFKQIQWASAKGYKEFNWEDQNVYSLGYEYAENNWAIRAGYNYGKSPIKQQIDPLAGPTAGNASAMNFFNMLGFPAIVEKHYTIGGTYAFSKMTSLDLAYAYSPEATETMATPAFTGSGVSSVTTKHSQDALSVQLNFAF